jgi:8-oxo-dGTP diphosphatase
MPISPYLAEVRALVGHRMLMIPSVTAVVVGEAGELLLGRRADTGRWALPAGIVDPGEQPADAIVREVLEECAVEIRVDRLAGTALHPKTYPNGDQCQFFNIWFLCTATGGEARVNDEESLEVGWFAPEAMPELPEWDRQRIGTALDGDPAAWFAPPGTNPPWLGF